ncbi:hypothetical protein AVEN_207169-1 [Araneus ventricosus]|uniref:Uncharacterized protein n=1 Tax=Araneus ventricosus TaxID=182803 RepID=A0A4Y1ZN39_ARAVE|nr:hypothetical protein AVEN_258106-1 [Araneus ventricosus]GBL59315.1 hypothetical protein AVEN_259799-1 [Araneus ventricosus]GBL59435.1 hypothetical protein AVEN_168404-1 [Araneus ventricosus]GBL62708.1 hypothetical protein AVEN_207169-1 [Araneus ventricosus]
MGKRPPASVVRNAHSAPAYPNGCKAWEQLMWCGSLERRVPAQVSPSSTDRASKLPGASQNRLRAASKQNVNRH